MLEQFMTVPAEISEFSPEEGLTFLEHLAHNLTIAVRAAAEDRPPVGELSEEQCRRAMYWINEATHNVVQLTRDLRIGRETWNAAAITEWVKLWLRYSHAAPYIEQAIERSIDETLNPYSPETP
jgi:hypothetical protein